MLTHFLAGMIEQRRLGLPKQPVESGRVILGRLALVDLHTLGMQARDENLPFVDRQGRRYIERRRHRATRHGGA